jgi:hypothetical protein
VIHLASVKRFARRAFRKFQQRNLRDLRRAMFRKRDDRGTGIRECIVRDGAGDQRPVISNQ